MAFCLATSISSQYIKYDHHNMQVCRQPLPQQILYTALHFFRGRHFHSIHVDINTVVIWFLRLNAVAVDNRRHLHNFEPIEYICEILLQTAVL